MMNHHTERSAAKYLIDLNNYCRSKIFWRFFDSAHLSPSLYNLQLVVIKVDSEYSQYEYIYYCTLARKVAVIE